MYNHGACSGQAGRRIPRVRGWERGIAASEADPAVHPARARVGTTRAADRPGREGSSRACAGGKMAEATAAARVLVHPARARVGRPVLRRALQVVGSSRACAGGKARRTEWSAAARFIPRVRGWEACRGHGRGRHRVHPARARVGSWPGPAGNKCTRSSRACAGGKNLMLGTRLMSSIIPRVRGWKRSGCGCCWS